MTIGDVQAAIDAGRQTASPHKLALGEYHVIATADGVEQIDLTGDEYQGYPSRINQTVRLFHPDSLLVFWDKHSDPDSEVYADRLNRTITAVLDAHHGQAAEEEFRPRWQTHRAVLALTLHDAMTAWLNHDDKMMGQVQFAEFIEAQLPYIVDPAAADLLEMVQDVQASVHAQFKSGYKIANGARQLQWTETVDTRTQNGTLEVPTTIGMRLPVWRGADTAVDMTARLRVRPSSTGLSIGYKLDRPTEVIDGAFEDIVAQVTEHVARPVLRGAPAAGA